MGTGTGTGTAHVSQAKPGIPNLQYMSRAAQIGNQLDASTTACGVQA
jgi:hypothetical protein